MSKILKYTAELGEDGAAYSAELCPYGQTAGDRNVVIGLGSYSCSKCRFNELRDPFEQVVKCKFEVLDLSLTFQWYDMIESGKKQEDYRELSDFYFRRLYLEWRLHLEQGCYKGCNVFMYDPNLCARCKRFTPYPYDAVRFHHGQGGKRTMLWRWKDCRIGHGNPKWGAPTGRAVFIIQLGDRIL